MSDDNPFCLCATERALLLALLARETGQANPWSTASCADRAGLYNRGLINRSGTPTDKARAMEDA